MAGLDSLCFNLDLEEIYEDLRNIYSYVGGEGIIACDSCMALHATASHFHNKIHVHSLTSVWQVLIHSSSIQVEMV